MDLPIITYPAHWPEVDIGQKTVEPGEVAPHEVMAPAPPRGQWARTRPHAAAEPEPPVPAPVPAPEPVPVAAIGPVRIGEPTPPRGPSFSRQQLETLASGAISSVFGPFFAAQDQYARQVRMPMPPLLLADRVTGLVGEPGSHSTGVIWTETDITPDAWYLHHGRMPAGITVEAGQADLLLCSWLGADLKNKGERVYRLLGCDLIFHGSLPAVGETVQYEIHITGHAELGGIRLFFFHSDCRSNGRLVQSVRNGQAGFFTDEELAHSEGVLWSPEAPDSRPGPGRVDPAPVLTQGRSFDAAAVQAFAEGRLLDCFGPGFEIGASHTRSPGIPAGDMRLIDHVPQFEPAGGPWGRGYLRAERSITGEDWFFAGHFKNDPCMPGTLMCEGGMQAMAFLMAALGLTLVRDGWRFEPLPGEAFKMRCRGQLTPTSRLLVYEVFVREMVAGPEPYLKADLLCTVDGQKAFHSAGASLRLSPGWPGDLLPPPPRLADGTVDLFSVESAAAVALGQPSLAFGPRFERFDSTMRGPRLPGAPYHFITRVVAATIPDGPPQAGASVEAAYDIPPDAWYFDENGARTMPFAVLLEAALQPCGWLATSVGCPLLAAQEVFFRNLDGTAVQHRELTPESGRLTTRATLTSVSILGPMTLVNFDVSCEAGGESIITLKTGFGFFPEAALANQVGLPMTPAERTQATQPGTIDLDLASRPASLFGGTARLADGKLLMLDRITGHWPDAGRAGLGIIRGTKAVDPREWFFKAHFFQDPVQPGSLGVEALLQLLQAAMLRDGMAEGIPGARFEPLALGQETVWRYRGQVVPRNQTITTVVEVLERGRDERGAYAIADGVLLVDGRKIYHLPRLGMRIVPGAEPPPDRRSHAEERVLDPARDTWLVDHCPTYVIPVVPMMVTVDILADAASRVAGGRLVVALHGLKLRGWIAFPDGPRRLRIEAERDDAGRVALRLLAWREARVAAMSRFDVVATATAELADAWPGAPAPWPGITGGVHVHGPARDMYDAGDTFHGPSFRRITSLRWDAGEGSAVIDADPGSVPSLLLNPLLLDSTAQAIVSDTIGRLDTSLPADMVCFPSELERIMLHGPAPSSGAVRAALRYRGRRAEDPRFLRFGVQIIEGGRVWAELDLTEVMFRKGRLVGASATDRRDLALRRRPVPGMTISTLAGGATLATTDDVGGADWFPGTVGRIYGIDATEPAALRRMVAVKDHMATSWGVHPSTVTLDGSTARSAALPFLSRPLAIRDTADATHVADAGPDTMDRQALADFWMPGLGGPRNAIIQVLDELCALFLRQLRLDDPAGIAAIHGRPVLLLGNHQVHLESVMFSELIAPVLGSKVVTVSRTEHRTSWIGATATLSAGFPGAGPHEPIVFFDRADPAEMLRLLADYRTRLLPQGRSLMVHVTGEVALSCREAVTRVSSVLLDLAVECGLPIVPVRFMGALPVAPLAATVTFPAGFSRQDIALGAPIMPVELQGMRLVERGRRVIDAINGIAPEPSREAPLPPRPELAARVGARMAAGQAEVTAVLAEAMDAVAMREPALAAFARGEVPAGWHGAELEWGQAFIGWLRGG